MYVCVCVCVCVCVVELRVMCACVHIHVIVYILIVVCACVHRGMGLAVAINYGVQSTDNVQSQSAKVTLPSEHCPGREVEEYIGGGQPHTQPVHRQSGWV